MTAKIRELSTGETQTNYMYLMLRAFVHEENEQSNELIISCRKTLQRYDLILSLKVFSQEAKRNKRPAKNRYVIVKQHGTSSISPRNERQLRH